MHRPNSPQSVIRIGNPSLRRRDDDYVPLTVANHVLGGGASSRLFMDLRELRSLTYGAYARVSETVDLGTWGAAGQVRTPATGDAMYALYRHLECVTTATPPDAEMAQTRSYLIDSFPLSVETPGNIADLIVGLRLFGLPDTWYDNFRTRVQGVDAATALSTAQRYIHPDRAAVVVVGDADARVEVGAPCAAARQRSPPTPRSRSRSRPAPRGPAPERPPRRRSERRWRSRSCSAPSAPCACSTSTGRSARSSPPRSSAIPPCTPAVKSSRRPRCKPSRTSSPRAARPPRPDAERHPPSLRRG